jgi:hypothetical protein
MRHTADNLFINNSFARVLPKQTGWVGWNSAKPYRQLVGSRVAGKAARCRLGVGCQSEKIIALGLPLAGSAQNQQVHLVKNKKSLSQLGEAFGF